jgi:aspartate/glutamate/glutamine transport system substrate-binding protein
MHRRILALTLAACVLWVVGCGAASAPAQAREGSLLRKIQDRGRLLAGVTFDQPTFGYQDPATKQMSGFDVALAHEVAATIFGDAGKVDFVQTLAKDRIPFLKAGTIDIAVATFSVSEDRLKDADFSAVYYVAGQRLMTLQGSPIKSVADIGSTKVGTTRGSTSAENLRKLSRVQIIEFDSFRDATAALITNQIGVVSTDDSILYGLAMQNPKLQVVGAQFSFEPYAIGVPKGQPELLDTVNLTVQNLKSSGKWKTIWKSEIGDRLGLLTVPDPPADDWRR